MKPYRPSRFRLSWAHLVIALLLIAFGWCQSRCRDQYPLPPGIEGQWRQTTSPYWLLDFDNGLLTQKAKFAGQPLTVLQFTYAERLDTLYIGGDLSNAPRTWLVRLIGDNDLKAVELQPEQPVWPVYYFERQ
jgi:hypothetical protein